MGFNFKGWRWRRAPAVSIEDTAWAQACATIAPLAYYDPPTRARLRALASLFLSAKHFSAAGGYVLDEALCIRVAVYACLPILNLGLDYYAPWREIIIYPAPFVPLHAFEDDAGVVHTSRDALAGEAWLQGPIIFSAPDVAAAGSAGVNVVLHECAHKIDMLNGDANGFPPLHARMDARAWSTVFSSAYNTLCTKSDVDDDSGVLDPYGAESPGEFFAVATEAFFEMPAALRAEQPDLYHQLSLFYRQTPAG